MKNLKFAALIVAGLLTFGSAAVSCSDKKNIEKTSTVDAENPPTNVYAEHQEIGVNEHKADLSAEISANNTAFTLNSVIDPGYRENGKKYIFLDITINNTTDSAYDLSTLNNFYLKLNDGTEVYSNIATSLYAMSNFKENTYFKDPFNIPANDKFSGVVGGFIIDENVNEFTVGFFPTQNDVNAKEDVCLINITDGQISDAADLLK